MADHENRLHLLEQYRPIEDDTSLKDYLIRLLAKSTIIGIVVIGSLTGAGGIICKILGL